MKKDDGVREVQTWADASPPAGEIEAAILRAVRGIRFGSVEIVIHEARVVQIERRDRVRFERVRVKEGR